MGFLQTNYERSAEQSTRGVCNSKLGRAYGRLQNLTAGCNSKLGRAYGRLQNLTAGYKIFQCLVFC
ncbi:hypothetical protein C5167_042629 [Papaver somniferum]|uniref:Uncharacterized protein n=1 Tax=Papaver somniferum TaxID=3469 RepID=A0A4Y7L4E4_PAPSO|nr:hypothetical protein C5167_042629 [Papaver somniferum]